MLINVIFEDSSLLAQWLERYSAILVSEAYVGNGVSLARIDDSPFDHDVWVDRAGEEFHAVDSPIPGVVGASKHSKGDAIKQARKG